MPDRVDVGFRSERGPVLIALMLATALVALESTILATAIPTIVGDLGGFTQFPWLFSSYLLTQAVLVPVYGKLSDIFGRTPVLLFGIGMFAAGSVLCALAWSMPALIAFRASKGSGRARYCRWRRPSRATSTRWRNARSAGLPGQCVGHVVDRGTHGRWCVLGFPVVAVDLLVDYSPP